MAQHTNPALQKQVIYSIYVRAHTPEGTFRAVIDDLDRIRTLGVDIIWFMPIHPIGVQGKKGSLGCPYANRDYRAVNPAYGTMDDFRALVDAIHARGMKCIIDVVYNHTSPDSVLYAEHPEWFHHDASGRPGNKIGSWSDVIDLDYSQSGLRAYLIETLVQWAKIVDGFRCDVASFVPVDFWLAAREAVERVRPGCIWLAESVHLSYGNLARRVGVYSARDYELYEAFDMEYEYDIREVFDRYLRGEVPLSCYVDLLNRQEAAFPENYNKLRFLENHDQPRIASLVHDEKAQQSYAAFLYFLKGTTLLYAGQEFADEHLPSLFEREPIDRSGHDSSALLRRLYDVKQQFGAHDWFLAEADDASNTAILQRGSEGRRFVGVFPLRGTEAQVRLDVPDGVYENLVDGARVSVQGGTLRTPGMPVLLHVESLDL